MKTSKKNICSFSRLDTVNSPKMKMDPQKTPYLKGNVPNLYLGSMLVLGRVIL